MFDMYGVSGIVIVKEHQGDERLYVKSLKNLYSFEEFEQVKAGLADFGFRGLCAKTSGIFILRRTVFTLCARAPTQTIRWVSALISVGSWKPWFSTELARNSRIVLSDEHKTLICDGESNPAFMSTPQGDAYIKENEQNLVGQLTDARTKVTARLYYEEALVGKTFAYFFLQLLAWLSLIILFFLWLTIRRQVIAPMKVLQKGMHALDGQAWDYRITDMARTDEYTYIYNEFNKMAEDILQSHEKDIELYKTQMDNLKLQVNPHMLLNSLTMIYSLAETQKYPLIQKYTMNLVEYFRYCLRENNSLVLLKSELRFVENYMEIQKLRYPDHFSCVYMMEDGLKNALIPPLLIQNFVENATKYARMPDRTIEVLINIRRDAGRLCISVSDTGNGIDDDILALLNAGQPYIDKNGMKHIGVWNCRRRLELFYEERASLRITSKKGEGTQVWIEFPYGGERDESADRG